MILSIIFGKECCNAVSWKIHVAVADDEETFLVSTIQPKHTGHAVPVVWCGVVLISEANVYRTL